MENLVAPDKQKINNNSKWHYACNNKWYLGRLSQYSQDSPSLTPLEVKYYQDNWIM